MPTSSNSTSRDLYRNQLTNHFIKIFGGKPQKFDVYMGLNSNNINFDLYYISPSESHLFTVVFTCGLGQQKMPGIENTFYAEFCFFLPAEWHISQQTQWDPYALQPFKTVVRIGNHIFDQKTFFFYGSTVPYVENAYGIDFTGILFASLKSQPEIDERIDPVKIRDCEVHILGLVQLYKEEMDYKVNNNHHELLEKFREQSINPFIFDPKRRNLFSKGMVENNKDFVSDKIDEILKQNQANPHTLEEWHQLANKLSEQGETANTTTVLNQIVKIFPFDYLAFFKLATNMISKKPDKIEDLKKQWVKNIHAVKKNLQECLRLNENFADAWLVLGNVYLSERRYADSIYALTRCTELEPESYKMWKSLSKPYLFIGELNTALRVLKKAHELNPKDEEINKLIAEIKLKTK